MLRPGGATGRWSDKNVGHRTAPEHHLDPLHAGIQSSIVLGAGVRYAGGAGNLLDFPDAIEKQCHSMAKIDAGR